jgi:4-amino-4-deoxy-L-arabinose transferase-like glycosyltransferase
MLKIKTLPFWLFTFTMIIILILSDLIRDGIFMDGMLYISVSKNLAEGFGSFWDPHFSATSMSSFHEQPPLYFGLLAIFYQLLGTSMYVERLFCFLCFVSVSFYIHQMWKKIYAEDELTARNSWLPVLFWSIIPVCFWAYANHVEETLMVVFATASVYYIYCALFRNEKTIRNLLLGGLFIFLSTLTKGIQGAFPIIAAAIFWLVNRNISFRKMLTYSLLLLAVPAFIYTFLLLINPDVYASYEKYFRFRLVDTFNNVRPTTENRLELLKRLFLELLPVILLAGCVLFLTKKYRVTGNSEKSCKRVAIWLLLIGLSGSLPLMVTLEQRRFYLVTAMPFFVLSMSMIVAPGISGLINKIDAAARSFKLLKLSQWILLVLAFVFAFYMKNEPKRDKDLLSDIYYIGQIVPEGEVMNIPAEMYNDWGLRTYLIRNFRISLDDKVRTKYFLIRKDLSEERIPENYKPFSKGTKVLDLYVLSQ